MIALFTGGASSGKSACAEQLCTRLGGNLVYLAAMRPYGEEGARRVQKHRSMRAGKGFRTVECYEGLGALVDSGCLDDATVLLECLGNVVANELYTEAGDLLPVKAAKAVIERDFDTLVGHCAHVVVVGNEVGSDGVAYDTMTLAYQELVGSLACRIASKSDLVAEVVASVCHIVKKSRCAREVVR